MTNPQQVPSADDLLFGGGAPSLSFKNIGDGVTGTLVDKSVVHKKEFKTGNPEFWPDGKPKYQLVLTLQTTLRDPQRDGDDGQRRIYCSPQLKVEVAKAVKAASPGGAKGLPEGSQVTIQFVREVPSDGGGYPKKEYTAQVVLPADGLLGVQAQQPVQQAQQPVQQPVQQVQPVQAQQPVQQVAQQPQQAGGFDLSQMNPELLQHMLAQAQQMNQGQ